MQLDMRLAKQTFCLDGRLAAALVAPKFDFLRAAGGWDTNLNGRYKDCRPMAASIILLTYLGTG